MVRVIWSPQAVSDLERIFDYIADESIDSAAGVIEAIFAAVERVRDFPESGRVIPELQQARFREVIVAPFRVMYEFRANSVLITGVVHGARDWP